MFMKEIEVYKTKSGKCPLNDWLDSIKDFSTRARIETRLNRLKYGNFGDYKYLSDGVSELRLQFGSGYRIYYSEIDNIIILLLLGGDKSIQNKDITKAKEYLKIYKENK
ncbi:MAG: addiction module protein [Candidatus Melainabacteria bacterium GWF2_37_15]|nr:MAG: addiction module protein [Candidatus Melainabacteria bacterium GWF2_37_15]